MKPVDRTPSERAHEHRGFLVRLSAIVTVTICGGELLIMQVLKHLPERLHAMEGPIDAVLLAALTVPAVYWTVRGLPRRIHREVGELDHLLARWNWLSHVFDSVEESIAVTDPQGRMLRVNGAFTRLTGYSAEEAQGRPTSILSSGRQPASFYTEMWSQLLSGGSWQGLLVNKTKAGQFIEVHMLISVMKDPVNGQVTGYVAIHRDVTHERATAREQAQAQKLAAVGQLASGMAHEINTPVQFIGDNVQFLADSFGDLRPYLEASRALGEHGVPSAEELAALKALAAKADLPYLIEEVPRSLSEARDGVRRVAELVRALKEYAHPDAADMAPADINAALRRTLVLARSEIKDVASVETDLGTLPEITCHIGSLQQVFLNLLINAAHAIEEKQRDLPASTARGGIRVVTRAEHDQVVISIRDSGCGIPAEIRERIFEPFFTTKAVGKGTGQGLPLVRSVVDRHQGHLEIDSEVSVGTTFTLRLPTSLRAA